MPIIKPISSLSIRRVVNIYTLIVFVCFGIFLFFLGVDRYSDFKSAHKKTAEKATQIAAREIRYIIENKRHAVDLFSVDHRDQILALSNDPDNEELHVDLNKRIRRNIPDFFASNIMTDSGVPIIGDFDGKVGDLCLADMKHFIDQNQQLIRVHPNESTYHYDLLTRLKRGKEDLLFFVSFNLNELANLLDTVQPTNHRLILVNKGMQNLIEVTSKGSREMTSGRIDYRLTGDEKMRIMSSSRIDGTAWDVIDLHESELLWQYIGKIIKEYFIVYLLFGVIAFYMRYTLVNEDERRCSAELNLRKSNKEIQELNDKLERLSITDDLTGLYNRRYIDERLKNEWSRCQRAKHSINIVIIDIDYFKKYNDSYGHLAGDECLVSVSSLMLLVFKRANDIVARYGGEEFVVVMTDISTDAAEAILHQYKQALESIKIAHNSSPVSEHVTISAGLVSIVPNKDDTLKETINNADKALYLAKSKGRNQICVHQKDEKV